MAEWFKASVLKTDVGATLPRVRIPPLPKNLAPLRGLIFGRWSATNCLVSRRDSKPAAMFLFEVRAASASPKGKNREGRPEQNFRQEIYVGRTSSPSESFLIKKPYFVVARLLTLGEHGLQKNLAPLRGLIVRVKNTIFPYRARRCARLRIYLLLF